MPEWVTQREAARLLGVHVSAVPKMVRRGDLVPRLARPSLNREEVLALRAARDASQLQQEQRRLASPVGPTPPDEENEWLEAPAAAAVLGCSVVAINARARRDRVPSTLHGGRRWYRSDLLELWLRAREARSTIEG